jgi:hypothetical protein
MDALVEARRPERQPPGFEFAAEELLRERRALVGQHGLGGNQRDRRRGILAAQAVRDLRAGMPASDHHEPFLHAPVTPAMGRTLY